MTADNLTSPRKRKPIVKDNRSLVAKFIHFIQKVLVFLASFIFIVGIIILLLFYGSLRSFSQQKYPQLIVLASSNLDVKENPFLVINIDHEQNKITLLNINNKLKMGVLGGYGDYELRSVGPLLNIEKKPIKFIRSAYSFGLEQGFDQVALLNKIQLNNQPSIKLLFWQMLTDPSLKSTLSWWQRWQFFCFSWLIPDTKIEIKNIESAAAWHNWQKNKSQPINPTCSLSIINNTDKAKLASKIGQVLENSGARVVRTTTEAGQPTKTKLIYSVTSRDCDFTKQQIEQLLPFSDVRAEANNDLAAKYRADVVILVGDDLGELVDSGAILQ
jgi:hypothetical protein